MTKKFVKAGIALMTAAAMLLGLQMVGLAAMTNTDEIGIVVSPGSLFTYEGAQYYVPGNATNLFIDAGFESGKLATGSGDYDYLNPSGSTSAISISMDARTGSYAAEITAGTTIYRAQVTAGNTYVFSFWAKVPTDGNFDDSQRFFARGGGDAYGTNEIGREFDITGDWQQNIVVFQASDFAFSWYFIYNGGDNLLIDDVELYQASEYTPIKIGSDSATVGGTTVNFNTGLTRGGALKHTATLESYIMNEEDLGDSITAVFALYKNNKLCELQFNTVTLNDAYMGTVNASGTIDPSTIEFVFDSSIPTDDYASYSYMVFLSDSIPGMSILGEPSSTYPRIVKAR